MNEKDKEKEKKSLWQKQLEDTMNEMATRKFSYDINGDALYEQYKNNAMKQGKLAMQDTIGQASALTGGYANSYAQTAGQQAYTGYLKELDSITPDLYQAAMDRYSLQGQNLNERYATLSALLGMGNEYIVDEETDKIAKGFKDEELFKKWIDENVGTLFNEEQASQYIDEFYGDIRTISFEEIKEKASGFTKDAELNAYLEQQEKAGNLTPIERQSLYDTYKQPEKLSYKDRDYIATGEKKANIFGLNRNAELEDQYGDKMTIGQLLKRLQEEGMSEIDAKKYLVQLQKNLGLEGWGWIPNKYE